jgi:teichuronic acid biosynthesis glycosyltransferase TuaC
MPLRVLFVTNMWPDETRPWHGTFVKSQADSLERLGVDVEVLPIRGYAGRSAYASAVQRARSISRDGGFDVVHAHYGHSALVARTQRSAPLVVSYCGDDVLGTRTADGSLTVRSRLEATLFKQVGRVAAATITKSEEMERALPPGVRERNHVIPNGVDLERFRPVPRDEARARLGWPVDEPCAIFVGNPELPVKNFALAEQVHRRLAGSSRPDLQLRVAASVRHEDVPLWMAAADALLFTSQSEGSPNVIKEAMASELPIVSTPVGDVPERLAGIDGCAVCPPDPEALAAALDAVLDHGRAPEARRAVEPLGLEAVAGRIVGLYECVLGRSNGLAKPPVSA